MYANTLPKAQMYLKTLKCIIVIYNCFEMKPIRFKVIHILFYSEQGLYVHHKKTRCCLSFYLQYFDTALIFTLSPTLKCNCLLYPHKDTKEKV